MNTQSIPQRDRITIAILALGGQGGGVLADWIQEVANKNGYTAQTTSVPGVAQRTGSTVYYIEMVRRPAAGANQPDPVLAMMPVPGDVDIVLASELMEGGRSILRGFVTEDRTTLISSTHRIYAISEKAALGDGTAASQRIIDAAGRRAKRFIGFDMEAASVSAGSVISSVMFGALAGSDALPFTREMFEDAIRHGGKAVSANLNGFAAGLDSAKNGIAELAAQSDTAPEPTSETGRALAARIRSRLPDAAHAYALESVRRLMDYQDARYAELYLDRIERVHALDGQEDDFRLTVETARSLGRWMAYEDTIRVADLKIRSERFARIEREAGKKQGQVLHVTEYMHPRLREVCETLPAGLGHWILSHPRLSSRLEPLFSKGRHVRTSGVRWFIMLYALAGLRRFRRSTLRYAEEQGRIDHWLDLVLEIAARDRPLATEVAIAQRLVKGYSDTFENGLAKFETVAAAALESVGRPHAAETIRSLSAIAMKEEDLDKFAARSRETLQEAIASGQYA